MNNPKIKMEIKELWRSDHPFLISIFQEMHIKPKKGWSESDFIEAYEKKLSGNKSVPQGGKLCPKCQSVLIVTDVQLRRADEGANTMESCTQCNYKRVL